MLRLFVGLSDSGKVRSLPLAQEFVADELERRRIAVGHTRHALARTGEIAQPSTPPARMGGRHPVKIHQVIGQRPGSLLVLL